MNEERFVHYRTGYKEIDDEHFALLQTADEIVRLCRQHQVQSELVMGLLCTLDKQLNDHMQHEEALMREANYKYYNAHLSAHVELRVRFSKLPHPATFSYNHAKYVVDEVEHIFIDHIDGYDMQIRLDEPPTRPVPL
jgi:hemerythrin-like metal-binding protein